MRPEFPERSFGLFVEIRPKIEAGGRNNGNDNDTEDSGCPCRA